MEQPGFHHKCEVIDLLLSICTHTYYQSLIINHQRLRQRCVSLLHQQRASKIQP